VLPLLAPFAGGPAAFHGVKMVTTMLAPVFYVMVIFLLPLDIIMSLVFMSDKTGAARLRFKKIILIELALLGLLVLSWLPFVMALLRLQ